MISQVVYKDDRVTFKCHFLQKVDDSERRRKKESMLEDE